MTKTRDVKESGAAAKVGPGRVLLTLITPGQGSSGSYSAEVLKKAAEEKVFPRGTQSHINHDTAQDRLERPEGDLRNLIGILDEDARVDESGALVAEAIISSAWRDFVTEFQEFLGVSISASAEVSETEDGGYVIERLLPGPFNRADFVTVAGRGGKVTEVLEAARVVETRGVVTEALASDTRDQLGSAVRDAYPAPEDGYSYTWIRDFDPAAGKVWYEVENSDGSHLYEQTYTEDNGTVTLTGDPVEVRVQTSYVPVNPAPADAAEAATDSPSDPAGVTEGKEPTVATTQIEESELSQLRESAGRVSVLDTENRNLRRQVAEGIVSREFDGIEAPRAQARLVESALRAETFDAEALATEARESAAEFRVANGEGAVRGVGAGTTSTQDVTESAVSDEDILAELKGA